MQLVKLQNPRRRKAAKRRRNAAPARRRRNTTPAKRRNPAKARVVYLANPKRRARRRHNPTVKRVNKRRSVRRRNPQSLLGTIVWGGGGAVLNGIIGGLPLMLPMIGNIASSLPFSAAVSHGVTAFGIKWIVRKMTGSQEKSNLAFTGALIETALQAAQEIVPNYQGLIGGINTSAVIPPPAAQPAALGDAYAGSGPGFRPMGDVYAGNGPGFVNNFVGGY